jgi:hypothetical protein
MRSTQRILLTALKPTSLSIRYFHKSIPHLSSIRVNGERLWRDEDLQNAYRRGFENAMAGGASENIEKQQTAERLGYDRGFADGKVIAKQEFIAEYKTNRKILNFFYSLFDPLEKIQKHKYNSNLKEMIFSWIKKDKQFSYSISIRFFVCFSCIAFACYLMKELRQQYLRGETDAQYEDRKKIEKLCKELIRLSKGDEFLSRDIHVSQCKSHCDQAKQYFETMPNTMLARRKSGHGDPKLFGPRKLVGSNTHIILLDHDDNVDSPIIGPLEGKIKWINKVK